MGVDALRKECGIDLKQGDMSGLVWKPISRGLGATSVATTTANWTADRIRIAHFMEFAESTPGAPFPWEFLSFAASGGVHMDPKDDARINSRASGSRSPQKGAPKGRDGTIFLR